MSKRTSSDYIKTIAELKSISMAAEVLGISQPAISSFLKKKEKELGAVLFDRSKQPIELTDAGRVYIEYLDKSQGLANELAQTLADMQELRTGKLTIGGASFFNVSYIPKAVATFSKKYPGVDIEIVDGTVPELTSAAHQGNLDLFITPIAGEDDRFDYLDFLTEKIYLAVPEEWEINAAIKGQELCREDFAKLCENTFVVLKKEQHIGQKMEKLFEHFGCRPEHIITAEQTMTTLALTTNGVGVSLITESSIKHSGLAKIPKLYIADQDICSRVMYIAYPKNKYLSKASKEFIEILKEVNQ